MPYLEQGFVCEDPELAVEPVFKVDCDCESEKMMVDLAAQASNTTIGCGSSKAEWSSLGVRSWKLSS